MNAAKSSLILLMIGIAMVITLLIFATSFFGSANPLPTTNTPVEYPTPTPEIQYQPNNANEGQ